MSWTLYQEGKRRPPKSSGTRLVWAIVVLVFCVALLPFVIWGIGAEFAESEFLSGGVLVGVAALLLFGAVAAIVAISRVARARRSR